MFVKPKTAHENIYSTTRSIDTICVIFFFSSTCMFLSTSRRVWRIMRGMCQWANRIEWIVVEEENNWSIAKCRFNVWNSLRKVQFSDQQNFSSFVCHMWWCEMQLLLLRLFRPKFILFISPAWHRNNSERISVAVNDSRRATNLKWTFNRKCGKWLRDWCLLVVYTVNWMQTRTDDRTCEKWNKNTKFKIES